MKHLRLLKIIVPLLLLLAILCYFFCLDRVKVEFKEHFILNSEGLIETYPIYASLDADEQQLRVILPLTEREDMISYNGYEEGEVYFFNMVVEDNYMPGEFANYFNVPINNFQNVSEYRIQLFNSHGDTLDDLIIVDVNDPPMSNLNSELDVSEINPSVHFVNDRIKFLPEYNSAGIQFIHVDTIDNGIFIKILVLEESDLIVNSLKYSVTPTLISFHLNTSVQQINQRVQSIKEYSFTLPSNDNISDFVKVQGKVSVNNKSNRKTIRRKSPRGVGLESNGAKKN